MADGNVVPCTQISNNEIVLGNIKDNTLEEIKRSRLSKSNQTMMDYRMNKLTGLPNTMNK